MSVRQPHCRFVGPSACEGMQMRVQSPRLYAVVALAVVLAACGGGDGGTGPNSNQTLGSITVSPTNISNVAGVATTISVTALDIAGSVISGVSGFSFTSSDANVAFVSTDGVVIGVSAGSTSINVSLTRGGVTKTASVPVTVTGTLPTTGSVTANDQLAFSPKAVAVARGGSVTWTFQSTAHNVTFTGNPAAPPNIGDTSNSSKSLTFSSAGNFTYTCTIHAGMNGLVIVR
jgi:plastocyanin